MPYDMNNPHINMHKYEFNGVSDCLNHIVTSFEAYHLWNTEADKCAVKYDLRGLGRAHEELGKRASCDYGHFGKKAADHPWGIITMPDWNKISQAAQMGYFKESDLMQHMHEWDNHLSEMRHLFTEAAWYLADCHEATLYRCLLDYVAQIENEMWAVEVIADRITPDNYQHPDAKQVFKKLHVYFAECWDGGKIDFDI